MNLILDGIRVLLVEDDEDNLELTEFLLQEHGAIVTSARSAADARRALQGLVPHVIVSDLNLPGEDGCALLASLRARPEARMVPAIALTGMAEDAALIRAAKAGFVRYVTKPAELPDILEAIASVVGQNADVVPPSARAHALREKMVTHVARGDLRELVALLNAQGPYRFTSIHRFDGDAIVVLAAFDRENVAVSSPAVGGTSVASSYCAFVRSARAPFVVADASNDARLSAHPQRGAVSAYCGVPILRPDGTVLGSICHSDTEPRAVPDGVRVTLEVAARMLGAELRST